MVKSKTAIAISECLLLLYWLQFIGAHNCAFDFRLFDKGLTKEEFCRRAQEDPDFCDCFGMFTYIKKKIVEPIEQTVSFPLIFTDRYMLTFQISLEWTTANQR
jgi:hypothetical protein